MELKAKKREIFGKKTKNLRKQDLIPGEVYGRGLDNRHIQVPTKEFKKIYEKAGEHAVFELDIENEKIPVIVKNVHKHFLTGNILSFDLHQVRMDELIEATVPIEFTGESPATKLGLILVKVLDEIEVESLPGNLPDKFEIDVSKLTETGQSISVNDVSVPKNVKILNSPETVIVTLSEQEEEEEKEAPTPNKVPTEAEIDKESKDKESKETDK